MERLHAASRVRASSASSRTFATTSPSLASPSSQTWTTLVHTAPSSPQRPRPNQGLISSCVPRPHRSYLRSRPCSGNRFRQIHSLPLPTTQTTRSCLAHHKPPSPRFPSPQTSPRLAHIHATSASPSPHGAEARACPPLPLTLPQTQTTRTTTLTIQIGTLEKLAKRSDSVQIQTRVLTSPQRSPRPSATPDRPALRLNAPTLHAKPSPAPVLPPRSRGPAARASRWLIGLPLATRSTDQNKEYQSSSSVVRAPASQLSSTRASSIIVSPDPPRAATETCLVASAILFFPFCLSHATLSDTVRRGLIPREGSPDRVLHVLEVDAAVLDDRNSPGHCHFTWPRVAPPIHAAIVCYDASDASNRDPVAHVEALLRPSFHSSRMPLNSR
jgi:hypothetical protein